MAWLPWTTINLQPNLKIALLAAAVDIVGNGRAALTNGLLKDLSALDHDLLPIFQLD
jgi:hypothetical protein